jgi:hypothetical protein
MNIDVTSSVPARVYIALYGLPRASASCSASLSALMSEHPHWNLSISTWYRNDKPPASHHGFSEPVGVDATSKAMTYFSSYWDRITSMKIRTQNDIEEPDKLPEIHGTSPGRGSNLLNTARSISLCAQDLSDELEANSLLLGANTIVVMTRQDIFFSQPLGLIAHSISERDIYTSAYIAQDGRVNAEDLVMVFRASQLPYFCNYFRWVYDNFSSLAYNPIIQYFQSFRFRFVGLSTIRYGESISIDRSYASSTN